MNCCCRILLWLCVSGALVPGAALAQSHNDYSVPAAWLCFPGRADVCSSTLTATVLPAGSSEPSQRTYAPAPAPPIDCFYVYPTVSREARANADMTAEDEEQHTAKVQFARFAAKCRAFAPLYRQITVAVLKGDLTGGDRELAYRDIRDAWHYYLAKQNHGRGVVLIGHSQGANVLSRLIAEEIDGKKDQHLLVSAILAGTTLQVPVGQDAGGTFQHIAVCHNAGQIGCVIAYSSFLADDPPGPDSAFGVAAGPNLASACVNPAALIEKDTLDIELPTVGDVAKVLGTDFVENPGAVSGRCTTNADRTFLAISIKTTDPRSQRLGRALAAVQAKRAGWGLHALDINLALGDLVDVVGQEGQSWSAQAHPPTALK